MIPRDDLRIGPKCGEPEPHDAECYETATDADLAAMDYYKLEGIDVERLRRELHWIEDVIRQVLAALDGEEA